MKINRVNLFAMVLSASAIAVAIYGMTNYPETLCYMIALLACWAIMGYIFVREFILELKSIQPKK